MIRHPIAVKIKRMAINKSSEVGEIVDRLSRLEQACESMLRLLLICFWSQRIKELHEICARLNSENPPSLHVGLDSIIYIHKESPDFGAMERWSK